MYNNVVLYCVFYKKFTREFSSPWSARCLCSQKLRIIKPHRVFVGLSTESESFRGQLNGDDESGLVLAPTSLCLSVSINLMSEYTVALGHYTIPL